MKTEFTQAQIDLAKKRLHYPSELELLNEVSKIAEQATQDNYETERLKLDAEKKQDQFITAEQARALGAGNAEWRLAADTHWKVVGHRHNYMDALQYRAIRKEVSAEPLASLPEELLTPEVKKALGEWIDSEQEPHAKLRALYAQQKYNTANGLAGGLEDFVWEWCYQGGVWQIGYALPKNSFDYQYHCTPKPTCQVRNDDTGELKTMTRESAQKLQAELGDTVAWFWMSDGVFGGVGHAVNGLDFIGGIYSYKLKADLVKLAGVDMPREAAIAIYKSKKDTCYVWYRSVFGNWIPSAQVEFKVLSSDGEYQLRPKALKDVSWLDMPCFVKVQSIKSKQQFIFLKLNPNYAGKALLIDDDFYGTALETELLELAPADQQPWINWRGGDCPVPSGVMVEATLRSGYTVDGIAQRFTWKHGDVASDIIEYRVIGTADGWKLK